MANCQGFCEQVDERHILCAHSYHSAYVTIHEAFVHLTHTHLVVEAVLPATLAQFADEHPLFQLLDAHMEVKACTRSRAELV